MAVILATLYYIRECHHEKQMHYVLRIPTHASFYEGILIIFLPLLNNCLVLDSANLMHLHGSIVMINISRK